MNKLAHALTALLIGLAGGCSDDEQLVDDDDAQAGCHDGESRCQGAVIETCSGGVFVTDLDCAASGSICELRDGTATCVGSDCDEGTTRCQGSTLETCSDGSWGSGINCAADGRVCRTDDQSGADRCSALGWTQLPVTIDDPVITGSSLMTPVDGISFGYDPNEDAFITSFGRELADPSSSYLWHLAGTTGTHTKKALTGTSFAPTEGFCMGAENWCQFIGFDPQNGDWLVVGPSTTQLLRVTSAWQASLQPVSGTHPDDQFINHSHRFAWPARALYLYGATGPSSFGDTVFAFDLDAASWSEIVTGLPQVDDNCLAYDSQGEVLYSIGGRITYDGGETVQVLDTYAAIDLTSGTQTTAPLPAAMGGRRAMSCAYDSLRQVIYVFAGSVMHDNWNEALNEYHNDLWVLDPAAGPSWIELIADSESGTLSTPDAYGDQAFTGFPEGPNFGRNRGHLHYDAAADRLMIMGAVPQLTHEQIYFLELEGLSQLLE